RTAQRLAELDAPLVEAVDSPDRPRGEDAVLVQREQRSEGAWREAIEHERRARTVAREVAMRLAAAVAALHQRLALGETVGQEHPVLPLQRGSGRVVAAQRLLLDEDELDRDDVAPLVQHLEVRVLRVGPGLAPDD